MEGDVRFDEASPLYVSFPVGHGRRPRQDGHPSYAAARQNNPGRPELYRQQDGADVYRAADL